MKTISTKYHFFPLFLALFLCSQSCTLNFTRSASHGLKAEQLQKDGEYLKAIEEYKLHIQTREIRKKDDDENPYFYYLLIGDCFLSLDQIPEAEESFLTAKRREVSLGLVAERLRRIAKYHEQKENFDEALSVLKKYRELDPLIFDLEIDRMHKSFVAKEIEKEQEHEHEHEQEI